MEVRAGRHLRAGRAHGRGRAPVGGLLGGPERGVVVEGYSGLKGGTMELPAVVEVAQRLERTPAQVLVAWQLQHGLVVIPKSTKEARIRENADVADLILSPDDMAALDGLAGTA